MYRLWMSSCTQGECVLTRRNASLQPPVPSHQCHLQCPLLSMFLPRRMILALSTLIPPCLILLTSWGAGTMEIYPKPISQGSATSSGGGKLWEASLMVAQVSAGDYN
jgi:hypothetical protein